MKTCEAINPGETSSNAIPVWTENAICSILVPGSAVLQSLPHYAPQNWRKLKSDDGKTRCPSTILHFGSSDFPTVKYNDKLTHTQVKHAFVVTSWNESLNDISTIENYIHGLFDEEALLAASYKPRPLSKECPICHKLFVGQSRKCNVCQSALVNLTPQLIDTKYRKSRSRQRIVEYRTAVHVIEEDGNASSTTSYSLVNTDRQLHHDWSAFESQKNKQKRDQYMNDYKRSSDDPSSSASDSASAVAVWETLPCSHWNPNSTETKLRSVIE